MQEIGTKEIEVKRADDSEDSEKSLREREEEEEKRGCNGGNKRGGLIISTPCKRLTGIID